MSSADKIRHIILAIKTPHIWGGTDMAGVDADASALRLMELTQDALQKAYPEARVQVDLHHHADAPHRVEVRGDAGGGPLPAGDEERVKALSNQIWADAQWFVRF